MSRSGWHFDNYHSNFYDYILLNLFSDASYSDSESFTSISAEVVMTFLFINLFIYLFIRLFICLLFTLFIL
jgi:hypothetical protein